MQPHLTKCTFYISTLLLFLGLSVSATATANEAKAPIQVIVSTVSNHPFSDQIEALGTTKANETVVITPDTAAKIVDINFDDGQMVSKGTLLVTLDKSEEEANLRAAEAARLEASSAYERAKGLQKSSALSKGILQERLSALKQSEAVVQSIKSQIDQLTITAPFDGILGLREVSLGALVQPGDTITTLDDLSYIKVDFNVPSVFLPTLLPGLPIVGNVEAFGARPFTGSVRTVNTQVDPITRTVRVRALLANPDHTLKPGLLMTIKLQKDLRDALLIPEEALLKRSEKNFVYIVVQQGGLTLARQTEITIGGRKPGTVEVLSGLKAGDQVIVHGTMKVQDGVAIAIRATENQNESLNELLAQPVTADFVP